MEHKWELVEPFCVEDNNIDRPHLPCALFSSQSIRWIDIDGCGWRNLEILECVRYVPLQEGGEVEVHSRFKMILYNSVLLSDKMEYIKILYN